MSFRHVANNPMEFQHCKEIAQMPQKDYLPLFHHRPLLAKFKDGEASCDMKTNFCSGFDGFGNCRSLSMSCA
jgi:hypothetical protein